MDAGQTVRTVVPVPTPRPLRDHQPSAGPAGERVLAGVCLKISLIIFSSLILTAHFLYPPKLPCPPIILVSSSTFSMGNGGADSGFDAIDSIFIGLSSSAAGTALIPPHSRHLPMISHFSSGFTQMLTGSRMPPHEKPSPSSSCTAERQLGQSAPSHRCFRKSIRSLGTHMACCFLLVFYFLLIFYFFPFLLFTL